MAVGQGELPNKTDWRHGQCDIADAGESQPLVKESLTGTLTFTAASDQVTGTSTLFTTELAVGDFISLDADEVWVEIESIQSNTALTLTAAYGGTGGTGVGSTVASVTIPDGFYVTVVGKPGNGDAIIYLGKSKNYVESTTLRFDGLEAGLAHALRVNNCNLVWVDADTDGAGVSWSVEQ